MLRYTVVIQHCILYSKNSEAKSASFKNLGLYYLLKLFLHG